MSGWKRWLANSLLAGVLLWDAHGQALPDWSIEGAGRKPPDFGILDETGLFGRDSGAFKRISDRLRKLELAHGYKIYLVVEPVLIASTPPDLAARLRQAWLPEGNGVVLVFEADTRSLGIGQDLSSHPDKAENPEIVPSYETAAILSRVTGSIDTKLTTEAYLETLAGKLVDEFEDYFNRRSMPPPPERSVRLGLLITGALALLGLGAIGIGGLVRYSSMGAKQVFRFPKVDLPERLGAPCGAAVTARRFSKPQEP